MRNLLSAADIANNARMLRAAKQSAILLTEGDTDARLFSGFIEPQECEIVVAHNKDNALGAIELLEAGRFSGILAIVDADFWNIDGIQPSSTNVVVTDTHDVETLIIESPALDKILRDFGSQAKMSRLGRPIRDALLFAAMPIGLLRWHSSRSGLMLKFNGIRFNRFLDSASLSVDLGKLVKEVKANSNAPALDEATTIATITRLAMSKPDPWQVCSGHDLVNIFTISLKRNFGNTRCSGISLEIVEGLIRVAFDYDHFAKSPLWGDSSLGGSQHSIHSASLTGLACEASAVVQG